MRSPPTHLSSLCPFLPPFLFLSFPLPPTHLSCSLSSAWPGLRCLPPSCIPLALIWALASLEQGGTGNGNITQPAPTHRHTRTYTHTHKSKTPRNIKTSHLHGFKFLAPTITAVNPRMRQRSYRRWACSPCGLMHPLGSGRTRNSTV